MSKNMTDEQELFAPIASITAAPPAVEQEAETKKKPLPRPDKTDHYYLMVNGEMANIYDAAVDAVKGLKDQAMHKQDDVYLRDSSGDRMASKTLVEWEADKYTFPVAKLHETRFESELDLGKEIRHDLAAEGFDPDRVAEIDQQIEEKIEQRMEEKTVLQVEEKLTVHEPNDWREALGIQPLTESQAEVGQELAVEVAQQPSSWQEALGVEMNGGFQAEVEQGPSTGAVQQPQNWREALGVDWLHQARSVDLSSPDASTQFHAAIQNLRKELSTEAEEAQRTYNPTDPDVN